MTHNEKENRSELCQPESTFDGRRIVGTLKRIRDQLTLKVSKLLTG